MFISPLGITHHFFLSPELTPRHGSKLLGERRFSVSEHKGFVHEGGPGIAQLLTHLKKSIPFPNFPSPNASFRTNRWYLLNSIYCSLLNCLFGFALQHWSIIWADFLFFFLSFTSHYCAFGKIFTEVLTEIMRNNVLIKGDVGRQAVECITSRYVKTPDCRNGH